MAAGWIAVVGLVAACVLLGMNWAFQRNANGLPTPVLSTSSSNLAALESTPEATTSLPTALPTLAARPTDATGALEPTLLPNQDTVFGYGIQPLFDADPDAEIDQVATLGMNWVKIEVRWDEIEAAGFLPRLVHARKAKLIVIMHLTKASG